MKRFIIAAAAVALVAACQDSTSPTAEPSALPLEPAALPAPPLGTPEPSTISLEQSEFTAATTVRHLWAVVNLNGTLARGSRVTSVSRLGTGRYEVTFDRNVSGCAYIATTKHAYSQALGVFTAGGHLSPNGVYVETKNQGGGLTDGPFNVLAACGPLSTRFAVVGYSANLVRATSGTSLTSLGSGRYTLTFANPVRGCAYLATVADPGNGLVSSPTGVYTGSGSNAYTVYIETKNPGGGLQSAVPFHLALICPGTANARFAVVKASGVAQRASLGTTSTRLSIGNYSVASDVNISACAAVATRGSVDAAVPFSPATVDIVPRPNASTIGVQVRTLLSFGGTLVNHAFHSALIC
jgi:hypothetical protein